MPATDRLEGASKKAAREFPCSAIKSFPGAQCQNKPTVCSTTTEPTKASVCLPRWSRPTPCRTRAFPQALAKVMMGAMLCLPLALTFAQTAVEPPAVPLKDESADRPAPSVGDHSHEAKPLSPWQILTAGAANHDPTRRGEAVAALGTIGPRTQVVRLLEQSLQDEDSSIRQLAASTLGEMRARRSIPKLKEALHDDSPAVTFAAAKSLWLMGDRGGREIFIQILSGEKSSSNGLLKEQMRATKKKLQDPQKLALLGAKEAASSLLGPAGWGIKIMEEAMQDRSSSARAMSAILLGPDASPDALQQLQEALGDKNWIVRAAAAQALGSSRHRDQIQHLQPLLEDDRAAVRYMAAASIVRLSERKAGQIPEPVDSTRSDARPALDPHGPGAFR